MDQTHIRHHTLDTLRGFAVMGILAMNIISFMLPETAYMSPAYAGPPTGADSVSWLVMFIAVDSKMRGLFSMLFGASMLLVYDRAEAATGSGQSAHMNRMMWLAVFGLIHYFFIWFGDILFSYALCGLVGMFLLRREEKGLARSAFWLLLASFIFFGLLAAAMHVLQIAGTATGADAEMVKSYQEVVASLQPSSEALAQEVARMQGGWWGITHQKLTEDAFMPLIGFFMFALETLGLMAMGMVFFKNGFLTGQWETSRYKTLMFRCYAVGLPGLAGLSAWVWMSGFDPVVQFGVGLAWAMPFRLLVMMGHAAFFVLIIRRFSETGFIQRVNAAGRAAFTNYLGTSIIVTTLAYGYGFGLFGNLTRWQCYLIVPCVWVIMLAWSKPWLDRFTYGPLEWIWRSLVRRKIQILRKG
jgi:uncharacterized protein